jgi:hypothetical protein
MHGEGKLKEDEQILPRRLHSVVLAQSFFFTPPRSIMNRNNLMMNGFVKLKETMNYYQFLQMQLVVE